MATTRPLCDSSSYTARLIRTIPAQPNAVVQSGDNTVLYLTLNCAARHPRPKLAGILHQGPPHYPLAAIPLASKRAIAPLRSRLRLMARSRDEAEPLLLESRTVSTPC